jgi:cyanophycinase
MLITEGNKMEAIGSGMVVIIDGHDIRHSNIADIPEGNPMSVENIIVHLCAKGNGYQVRERKFVEQMAEHTTPVMKDWDS